MRFTIRFAVAEIVVLGVLAIMYRPAEAPSAYSEIGMRVCNPDGSAAGIIAELAFKDNQFGFILDTPGAPQARRFVPGHSVGFACSSVMEEPPPD
jgi:hypothetical protein